MRRSSSRRPPRAGDQTPAGSRSAHERTPMIAHPLLDALIQPSRPLPAQFRSGVGMPPKLPRLLRYGPVAPPQVGGSHFTGGQVAQPQTSLAHPQAAEGFTPPHYNAANPTAPSLAPFVQTAQGGQPTGPPFNM